jgi:protein-S-isoprenylcysteine O-methyltransferase Ste14
MSQFLINIEETFLAIYILFFAIIHSLTASRFVKQRAYKFVDQGTYRLLYTIVSIITLLPLLYLWYDGRSSSQVLYRFGFPYTIVSLGMLAAGGALIMNSLILIDALEFVGVKQVLGVKQKEKYEGLIIKGAYAITRHPLYLGGMLIFWSNPIMRCVDFIVAFLFSLYFIIGGALEERKLVEEFGEEYIEYQKEVSMFLPFKWFWRIIRS